MARAARVKWTWAEKNLIRRYVIWCYKTTREDLDRVDRYDTQEMVDQVVIKELMKSSEYRSPAGNAEFKSMVDGFVRYAAQKKANADKKKFSDQNSGALRGDYQYLRLRLKAVEEAARHFLGDAGLNEVRCLYEQEMTGRILAAREHA